MTRRARSLAALFLTVVGLFSAGAQEWVFESPREFAAANRRFPQAAVAENLYVIAYQRISTQTESGGLIDVEIVTSQDGKAWTERGAVVSDVPYDGVVAPPVFSLAVAREGDILLAVTSFEKTGEDESRVTATLHRSYDGGATFSEIGTAINTQLTLVAPLLAQRSDGGWFLFFEYVYEGSDSQFVVTRSDEAATWSELALLPIDNRLQNQVDLTHIAYEDRDLVAFSAENFSSLNAGLDENASPINPLPATFHLMSMYSDDAGQTWSAVDPADGAVSGPLSNLPVIDQVTPSAETGRAAVEELAENAIPYWHLRVSDVGFPEFGVPEYGDIVSRRPDLGVLESAGYIAWEAGIRRETDNQRQAVLARVDRAGNLAEPPLVLSSDGITGQRVDVAYNQPTIVSVGNELAVIAYDDPTRRGNVFLYRQGDFGWSTTTLSTSGVSTFPVGVAIDGRLHVFWQERDENATSSASSIIYLEPDQSALPPQVAALNYELGLRSRSSVAEFSWEPSPDAAGIVGYNYVWTRDPEAPVEEAVRTADGSPVSFEADEDGEWYLRIRAVDRLGNWSEPANTTFFRDTTPPGRVRFAPPSLDEDGYLASNTFTLRWNPPEDDVLGGYSYDFVYVGPEDSEIDLEELPVPEPPERLITTVGSVSQDNFDNGLWGVTVTAIDSVGNVGEPAVLYVRMNKYIPVTEIFAVAAVPDPLGRYAVDIVGRGFRANGDIVRVIIDADQQEPFDYEFDSTSPGFRIFDDRSMSGPILDDIETGTYWLGLFHAERGLDWDDRQLVLERNGTVKFGDFTLIQGVPFALDRPRYGFLGSVGALAWVVIALLAVVVVFSATRIASVVRDGRFLRLEARALVLSQPSPGAGRPKRIAEMRRRGIGLFAKFAFFVVVVVMAAVAMLAVGLGTATLSNQREILLQGLEDNVNVLMESIVAGAETLLPEPEINIFGLTDLPGRSDAMEEALYVTITGRAQEIDGVAEQPGYNYVWATNDPIILNSGPDEYVPETDAEARIIGSIDRNPMPEGTQFDSGLTVISDPVTQAIDEFSSEIDVEAREKLGDLPQAIEQTFNRVLELALASYDTEAERLTAEAERLRQERTLRALNGEANRLLAEIVGEVRSYPNFDPQTFTNEQRDFIFYRPVVYLPEDPPEDLTTAEYANGAVRIAVSTDLIVAQIESSRLTIIRLTLFIALAAIAAGIVGAVLLSAIVVRPIRRLVQHVQTISDTTDKRRLADHVIELRSRDELAQLADTVNEMNNGLVEAAEQDEELKVSSDMQKRFMPLESDGVGQNAARLTSAHADVGSMEFHGYYEGADALSGDFFSFDQLDDRQYALAKCDVSGHGVLAAIIMVEVATVYLNQLRDWRAKRKKLNLTDLLFTINDLVEERGFFGRFAAMTLGILDVHTGKLRVSHAGDNLLQMYRKSTGKVEMHELEKAPATGVFQADMVIATGQSFKEVTTELYPGDVLILATDGIDEAKRFVRTADYKAVKADDEQFARLCAEQGWGEPDQAKNQRGIIREEDNVTEDFTLPRMHRVIESILSGGTYTLERAMNPDADERLVFDFRSVEPTAENVALGLMAVEKIFRIYRDPTAGDRDLVKVDAKIASFLEKHFNRFSQYFMHPAERPDDRMEYLWFSHLREDEQRDDLTILAVRRKE